MTRVVSLVILLLVAAAAGAGTSATAAPTTMPKLWAWTLSPYKPPVGVSRLRWGGPVVKRLAPGRYQINVQTEPVMSFYFYGPGVERRTKYPRLTGTMVFATWRVRLKRGTYRYIAEGVAAKELQHYGFRIKGSFVVR